MSTQNITKYHFRVSDVRQDALLLILEDAITSLLFTTAAWNETKQIFYIDMFHNLHHTKLKLCVVPGDDDTRWWLNFKLFTCAESRELGVYAYHMIAAWEPLYSLIDFGTTHPDFTPRYMYEQHVLPCAASRLEVAKALVTQGLYSHVLDDEEVYAALDKEYTPLDVDHNGAIDDDRFDVCVYPNNQSEGMAPVPRYYAVGNIKTDSILQHVFPMLLNHMRKYGLSELVRILRRPSNVPACSETKLTAMLHGLMDQFDAGESASLFEAYLIYECANQIDAIRAHSFFPGSEQCLKRATFIFKAARTHMCASCQADYKLIRREPRMTGYEVERLFLRCVVCHAVRQ